MSLRTTDGAYEITAIRSRTKPDLIMRHMSGLQRRR
jgi:hypothetical protein